MSSLTLLALLTWKKEESMTARVVLANAPNKAKDLAKVILTISKVGLSEKGNFQREDEIYGNWEE